jgi:hypothetical protein
MQKHESIWQTEKRRQTREIFLSWGIFLVLMAGLVLFGIMR